MSAKSAAIVLSATATLGLLLPGHAAAKPDPGEPSRPAQSAATRLVDWSEDRNCLLRRVGREHVRCDDATGAGIVARRHVPVLEPGGRSVHRA